MSRWEVCFPGPGLDPFLAATVWLLDRECGALVGALPAEASVHARALFDVVPVIDPAVPGPLAAHRGLGLVLVEPTPATLEALDEWAFPARPGVMLLPSPAGRGASLAGRVVLGTEPPCSAGGGMA